MVQSPQYWRGDDWSGGLDGAHSVWLLEGECPMRPCDVVVLGVFLKHQTQVMLAQRDDVVDALPPQRPDQSLSDAVRLWRADRRQDGLDADTACTRDVAAGRSPGSGASDDQPEKK